MGKLKASKSAPQLMLVISHHMMSYFLKCMIIDRDMVDVGGVFFLAMAKDDPTGGWG